MIIVNFNSPEKRCLLNRKWSALSLMKEVERRSLMACLPYLHWRQPSRARRMPGRTRIARRVAGSPRALDYYPARHSGARERGQRALWVKIPQYEAEWLISLRICHSVRQSNLLLAGMSIMAPSRLSSSSSKNGVRGGVRGGQLPRPGSMTAYVLSNPFDRSHTFSSCRWPLMCPQSLIWHVSI